MSPLMNTLLLLLVPSTHSRLVVIPGKGCGTLKPLRPLNGEDADKIMSPSEAECGTIRAEDEVAVRKLTGKVDKLKCIDNPVSCRNAKDSIFIVGGADCSTTPVVFIEQEKDIPADPLLLQCALIDKSIAQNIRKGSQAVQVKWCLEENLECSAVAVSPTYMDQAPGSWKNVSCVLMTTALHAQEKTSIHVQWCLEGKHDCSQIQGAPKCLFNQTTLTDQALASWRNANCVLMPSSLYFAEEANIKVAWCLDNEANCVYLPAGYGYESGNGCSSTTETTFLEVAPMYLPQDFQCSIMTPSVFTNLTQDFIILRCNTDSTCGNLATAAAGSRSEWTAYTEEIYQNNVAAWGPQLSIDGTDSYYHATGAFGDFLQLDLGAVYFVTTVTYTTRTDCECRFWFNKFVEARVGMEDTAGLHSSRQLITTNQICSSGNPNYAFTNAYNCPQPLKGKYVTFQKVQQTAENPGWSMYINEVNVDAVSF